MDWALVCDESGNEHWELQRDDVEGGTMVDILFELEEARKVAGPAVFELAKAERLVIDAKSGKDRYERLLSEAVTVATEIALTGDSQAATGKNAEIRKAALDAILLNDPACIECRGHVQTAEGLMHDALIAESVCKANAKVALLNLSAYQSMAAVIAALGEMDA